MSIHNLKERIQKLEVKNNDDSQQWFIFNSGKCISTGECEEKTREEVETLFPNANNINFSVDSKSDY